MQTKRFLSMLCLFASLAGCAQAPLHPERPRASLGAPESALSSEVAMIALSQLGVPYANGGNSPGEGFDCSGLVGYAFKQASGVTLPRTTYTLAKFGVRVPPDGLQPGDLLFFNTLGRIDSHVGIYLGEARFIHAPSSGGVVRIEDMNVDYWSKRYNGARRITP